MIIAVEGFMGKMVTFDAFVGAVLFSFDISEDLLQAAHFSNIENMFVSVCFYSVDILRKVDYMFTFFNGYKLSLRL